MLADLGVRKLRLLTNNPAKMRGLSGFGIEVSGRVSLPVAATENNLRYLIAKRDRLGHQLDNLFIPDASAPAPGQKFTPNASGPEAVSSPQVVK
jgi:3,4-dihydroxy 2-butanone 4-phosphate synthase / GTP cyclohydrolase II